MTAHVFETHKNCEYPGTCPICDGGLQVCTVCGGAEASLPTACPERIMTALEIDAVEDCRLDYKNNDWIDLVEQAYRNPPTGCGNLTG